MRVTLICTVLNEADNIGSFLESIEKQTRLPDEIVVCDAGSRDGTLQMLREFAARFPRPFKVIEEPGNRSHGRNVAIQNAKQELIAGADAGCVLDPHWLECLLAPFQEDALVDVVSGFYKARGETWFEQCAAVVTLSTKGVNLENFLPSARSIAFHRSAWQAVGGFPENLDFAEDTQFGLALRAAGKRFAFAPDALVYWRPHNAFRKIFRQFHNYARGNAEAGILYRNYLRLHTRYLVWLILTASLFVSPWLLLIWVPAFLPYWAMWSVAGWRESHDWRSLLVTPLAKLVADAGQFTGFWNGFFHRKRA